MKAGCHSGVPIKFVVQSGLSVLKINKCSICLKQLYDILRNYIVVYKYFINMVGKILPYQLFSMLHPYQGFKIKVYGGCKALL